MTDTKIRNCALYCRVSTSRQAEKDLSIPDQLRHARQYCEQRDWELVREFVEPGASATNDHRPVFQELIAFACRPDKPIDAVLVHSFSRFFRDDYEFETYRRRLKRHKVTLISMTQEIADDPQGNLISQRGLPDLMLTIPQRPQNTQPVRCWKMPAKAIGMAGNRHSDIAQ